MPCSSSASLSALDVPKIWVSQPAEYVTFRWNPLHTVSCSLTMDTMHSSFYNGTELTSYVRGNFSEPTEPKRLDFALLPEGYLVFSGHKAGLSGSSPCENASFQISCSNNLSSSSAWEAYGAAVLPSIDIQAGVGRPEIWDDLCPVSSTDGIWATAEFASFRWSPVWPDIDSKWLRN